METKEHIWKQLTEWASIAAFTNAGIQIKKQSDYVSLVFHVRNKLKPSK